MTPQGVAYADALPHGWGVTNTRTHVVLPKAAGEILSKSEDARRSHLRFTSSNGVNIVDSAFDFPDGSHLEFVCLNPMGSCRYEWRLYDTDGVLVERHSPTPIGFHQGRWSDLMAETLDRYNRVKAESASAARLYVEVWCGGVVPTQAAIDEHRDRAARLRSGR